MTDIREKKCSIKKNSFELFAKKCLQKIMMNETSQFKIKFKLTFKHHEHILYSLVKSKKNNISRRFLINSLIKINKPKLSKLKNGQFMTN